jgi:predicted type IV restriction endonuclease
MPVDFETAKENLRAMSTSEGVLGSRNEATTRFQLIDRLLKEVLGWEIADIDCEVYREGDYADYTLGNPRRFAVWEAIGPRASDELSGICECYSTVTLFAGLV